MLVTDKRREQVTCVQSNLPSPTALQGIYKRTRALTELYYLENEEVYDSRTIAAIPNFIITIICASEALLSVCEFS